VLARGQLLLRRSQSYGVFWNSLAAWWWWLFQTWKVRQFAIWSSCIRQMAPTSMVQELGSLMGYGRCRELKVVKSRSFPKGHFLFSFAVGCRLSLSHNAQYYRQTVQETYRHADDSIMPIADHTARCTIMQYDRLKSITWANTGIIRVVEEMSMQCHYHRCQNSTNI